MSEAAVSAPPRPVAARLSRSRPMTVIGALVGLAALAMVAWGPGGLMLDVGGPGDLLFLRGVHGDERVDGRSYRWTRATSQFLVPGLGGAERVRVALLAQGGRTPPAPVPVTVLVDGQPAGSLAIGAPGEIAIEVERTGSGDDLLAIELQMPTFRPAGDARDLGVLLDGLAVTPLRVGPAPLAWAERWLRLAALAAGLAVVLWPLRRWAPAGLWLGLTGLAVAGVALPARPWLLAGWPWALAGLALAALAVHRQRVGAVIVAGLLVLARPRVATVALAALVIVQTAIMLALAARIEWIGHADYADNAVVARNLVRGRGYTVDYVAQFYGDYPATISHPSDVWPLLQPTLIAGSFLIFGVSTFAAKLPNVVALAGLLIATAWLGRRLFDPLTGLVAAGIMAIDGWLFENTLFPVNDIPFSLLVLLAVGLAAKAAPLGLGPPGPPARAAVGQPVGDLQPDRVDPGALTDSASAASLPRVPASSLLYAALGLCSGLLVVAKSSGLLVVMGLACWWVWQRLASRHPLNAGETESRRLPVFPRKWGEVAELVRAARAEWRGPVVAGVVALLVVTPLVGRNLVTFGQPFYSLQAFDAWVTKWEPPDENIYRLMQSEPPHPRRLVGFGLDRAIEAVAVQFRRLGQDLASGGLIETPLLVLAAVGLLLGGPAVRWQVGALAWAGVPYALFVLIYWHYEERYFTWLVPWVAVLAAGAAVTLIQGRLTGGGTGERWLGLGLAALAVVLLVPVRLEYIGGRVARLTPTAGDVIVGEWLAANTPPETVVMTRVPWQTTWHSGRRTVMIPLAPAEGIEATIRRYGVGYLVVNRLEPAGRRREALGPLYEGREVAGYVKVREFSNEQGVAYAALYRVPERLRSGP